MNKVIYIIALAFIFVSCNCQAPQKAEKQKSSDYLLLSTVWYQVSAERVALYHQAYNIAKMRIDQIGQTDYERQPAVVLDIDETVLDNSPYQAWCVQTGNKFSPETWNKWVQQADATPLTGALEFTKYAKENGVEVIYLSNRHVSQLEATLQNLSDLNFPNASAEYVFLKDSTSNKKYRREKVNEKYEIALLVGDNLGDFDHLYDYRANRNAHKVVEEQKDLFGDKFIMLPNPMYGKWERPIQKQDGNYTENLKKAMHYNFSN
ncbi:MAG: 5'-nucleotidase, lipoprotein e(P4) family [Salinivirgaceae bacterium]